MILKNITTEKVKGIGNIGNSPTLDSNFVSYIVNKKSTSRTCQFLKHALVSWSSKKKKLVQLSLRKLNTFLLDYVMSKYYG